MPKMKTNRSAAKRFRVTGTGKLMRAKAYRYHKLEHKSSVRTRRLAGDTVLSHGDSVNVKKMLGL
jgi:large subunit ribosomal protein L35